jgi:phytoene synthase
MNNGSEEQKNTNYRPFSGQEWPASEREDAWRLWQWHLSLRRPQAPSDQEGERKAFFEREAEKVRQFEPTALISAELTAQVYGILQRRKMPADYLADQVLASAAFAGRARFETASDLNQFVRQWAGSHGRLLAHLADAAYMWQLQYVDDLSRGFFLTGRLLELPQDLAEDRLFIPMAELERHGLTVERLKKGNPDEAIRRLLWRQVILARDALASGRLLSEELPRSLSRSLRKWWFGCLEVLNEIERRKYDVWSRPIEIPAIRRFFVLLQMQFGKAAFRSR